MTLRLSERGDACTLRDLTVRAMSPCCDDLHDRDGRGAEPTAQRFQLPAPADSAQAPLAEVFAIVANDVISILAKATARATNHIFPVEARIRVCAYGDGPAASEFRQRHLFYGSAVEPSDDTRVMDDPPVTHIEAVMDVAAARRDEMRSKRRLFSSCQSDLFHGAYRRPPP